MVPPMCDFGDSYKVDYTSVQQQLVKPMTGKTLRETTALVARRRRGTFNQFERLGVAGECTQGLLEERHAWNPRQKVSYGGRRYPAVITPVSIPPCRHRLHERPPNPFSTFAK